MAEHGTDPKLNRLLELAARGDASAWRELVEAYTGRVFGLVFRQCGDRDLAEEITQATFVQVVKHIGRYREQGRFDPWLFRIAMNRLRDEMRRRKRQAKNVDTAVGRSDGPSAWAMIEEELASDPGDDQIDPFEKASRAEQVEVLKRCIGQMNEADREILYMRHTAGLGFAEIAKALKQPLGTVLARGHRAMAKLKKILVEQLKEE